MYIDSQTWDMVQRIVLAIILGLAIGTQREFAHKVAGMRTHALVSLGAVLYTIMSILLNVPAIAANIVVGIGFLGGGIIILQGQKVQGVTTAAGIWVAAAVGMACGYSLYSLAIVVTLLTIAIFIILWPIENLLKKIIKDKDID